MIKQMYPLDLQESVRKAADLALKTLSKVGDISVYVYMFVYISLYL